MTFQDEFCVYTDNFTIDTGALTRTSRAFDI